MKKLIVLLTFLTGSLLGQDNPMFDSLDYFKRNKIKTVHWHISKNYCSPGWDYLKFSFNSKTNTLHCDSIHWDPASSTKEKGTSGGTLDFHLKDTVYHRPDFAYSTTIKHYYDKLGRLHKILKTIEYYPNSNVPGVSQEDKMYTTTIEYFYADAFSKKLAKKTISSLHFYEEINFFYDKDRLTKRVATKNKKDDSTVSTDTFLYEYYEDGKLKKETRQLIDTHNKQPICEGSIEYRYDTD